MGGDVFCVEPEEEIGVPRIINVIGVPFDFDGGDHGTKSGPQALMHAGLLASLSSAGHHISYADLSVVSECAEVFTNVGPPRWKEQYFEMVAQVARVLAARTFASLRVGHTPLVLGGDRSIAIGAIGAALCPDLSEERTLGLLRIDMCHGIHAMDDIPLSVLCGRGPHELRNLIGSKKIAPDRILFVDTIGIHRAIQSLAERVSHIWVSLDSRAISERCAHGVTHRGAALSRRKMRCLADQLSQTGKVVGADIVEYAPMREEYDARGRPKMATIATEFMQRLL